MGYLHLLLALVALVSAERPKQKDLAGNFLVKITDIPVGSCGADSYFGLGMMDGNLEKCEDWNRQGDEDQKEQYEEYKCKHLRVHGEVKDGKCQCQDMWKGPICNEYNGCPEGHSLYKGVCTANICQNNGTLAVGEKQIECICPVPWDGRYCERLACWRKTNFGQEKRYANDGTKCKCGKHYSGENCDVILTCSDGNPPVDGKCTCPEGFGGEICDRKCPSGQLTCSSNSLLQGLSLLFFILFNLKF